MATLGSFGGLWWAPVGSKGGFGGLSWVLLGHLLGIAGCIVVHTLVQTSAYFGNNYGIMCLLYASYL